MVRLYLYVSIGGCLNCLKSFGAEYDFRGAVSKLDFGRLALATEANLCSRLCIPQPRTKYISGRLVLYFVTTTLERNGAEYSIWWTSIHLVGKLPTLTWRRVHRAVRAESTELRAQRVLSDLKKTAFASPGLQCPSCRTRRCSRSRCPRASAPRPRCRTLRFRGPSSPTPSDPPRSTPFSHDHREGSVRVIRSPHRRHHHENTKRRSDVGVWSCVQIA